MRTVLLTLAAVAVAMTSAPAAAQPSADGADVRCLLVLQAVGRDPKQKEAAARGLYYFMGRLTARGGLARLDSLMLAEARKIQNAQQAQTELARCGAELTQRTNELQAVSQRLQKAAPPPAKK